MNLRIVGFVVGLLTVISAFLLAYFLIKNRNHVKTVYDERQSKSRGVAYKFGFIFCLISFLVLLIIEFISTDRGHSFNLIIPIALLISISSAVFACICIWKDAWISLYETPKTTIASCTLVIILNYLIGYSNLVNLHNMLASDIRIFDFAAYQAISLNMPFSSDKIMPSALQVYMPWINIIFASVMLFILINYIIKLILDRNNEKRELNEES